MTRQAERLLVNEREHVAFLTERLRVEMRRAERAEAVLAEMKAQVQHLEAVVERSAHYAAVGREVQKRVNRGEVEGSYLDLRGVKIPRTEART